jgi:hypothetical protein
LSKQNNGSKENDAARKTRSFKSHFYPVPGMN